MNSLFDAAAYGGPKWRPRAPSMQDEIGTLWQRCGQRSEWMRLRSVLLHRPGSELASLGGRDPDESLMLACPDMSRTRAEHDQLADAYRQLGVNICCVDPPGSPSLNLMFVADLMFMTPQGAIIGRPASAVRAGEERWIAARLAALGIPILRTVAGGGTFEGADAMWVDPGTVLIGRGLRTNTEGAAQVAATLADQGVEAIHVDLPYGTMHLMGQLRIVDRDLAYIWPTRTSFAAVTALRNRGYSVLHFPDERESVARFAHNFVTVGPREIVMPARCPASEAAYRRAGVTCHTVDLEELFKAAGGIGCLTGVLEREGEPQA